MRGFRNGESCLAFLRRLGIETAKDGLAFAAAAFGAFVFPFLPVFDAHQQGEFLVAFLAAKFVIGHNISSFSSFSNKMVQKN